MDANKPATTETLTDDMIRELRDEAAEAGDTEMVDACEAAISYALRGDNMLAARQVVCSAVNDARAQDDDAPFVRVVP